MSLRHKSEIYRKNVFGEIRRTKSFGIFSNKSKRHMHLYSQQIMNLIQALATKLLIGGEGECNFDS